MKKAWQLTTMTAAIAGFVLAGVGCSGGACESGRCSDGAQGACGDQDAVSCGPCDSCEALDCSRCPENDAKGCENQNDALAGDCGPSNCPSPDCAVEPENPMTEQEFCDYLSQDRTEENLLSLYSFVWSHSQAIILGQFSEEKTTDNGTYGLFTIQEVVFGWTFLSGIQVWVELPDERPADLTSKQWLLGLSNSFPTYWEDPDGLAWGNVLAFMPPDIGSAVSLTDKANHYFGLKVAVVKIAQQDDYRTNFEVIQALKGHFPGQFSENWYKDWDLPYPPPSDSTWIVTTSALGEYPDGNGGTITMGSVVDFRPDTAEARNQLIDLLAYAPPDDAVNPVWDKAQVFADSYSFHNSPLVMASVVTGLADECCTGAGGTYVSHKVVQALRGNLPSNTFVTGGHAYYGDEICGDGFVYGLADWLDPVPLMTEPFNCEEYPDRTAWEAWSPLESTVTVRNPLTTQSQAQVEAWLSASDPVYRLRPPDTPVEPDSLNQNPANAPWSMPRNTLDSLRFATNVAIITITDVAFDETLGAHIVNLSTTLTVYEYDHVPKFTFKLVFRCGDPRLLQKDARWAVGIYRPSSLVGPDEEPNLGRVFLLPGTLLPVWRMPMQLEAYITHAW